MLAPSRLAAAVATALSLLAVAACSSAPGVDGPSSPSPRGGASSGNGASGGSGSSAGGALGTPTSGGGSGPSSGSTPIGGSSGGSSGGATDDGGAPDPTADAGTGANGGAPSIEFAPYFPTWTWGAGGYAYSSLVDLKNKAGVNGVTIAFVLSNGGCAADDGIAQHLDDVNAFRNAGGHVKASFGGADGAYVESKCGSASALAKAIGDFVDATGITDLDFDVEQDPVMTDAVNQMRGEALKMVQDQKHVRVAFTLAANPSPGGGLTDRGLSVVSHAVSAGVTVAHVNLMTMDYGDSFGGQPMAPIAIGSLQDANAQLVSLIPGLTTQAAWHVLGVIPMIGKNDDAEVFSLDDAKSVAKFATDHQLGLVAFWSIDRDQTCKGGADFNSCSTVNDADFAFSSILKAVVQ